MHPGFLRDAQARGQAGVLCVCTAVVRALPPLSQRRQLAEMKKHIVLHINELVQKCCACSSFQHLGIQTRAHTELCLSQRLRPSPVLLQAMSAGESRPGTTTVPGLRIPLPLGWAGCWGGGSRAREPGGAASASPAPHQALPLPVPCLRLPLLQCALN